MNARPLRLFDEARPESFEYVGKSGAIRRYVHRRNGGVPASSNVSFGRDHSLEGPRDLPALYDQSWLRSAASPASLTTQAIGIADLFSGCGAMTLGVAEACRALNVQAVPSIALDINPNALQTYGLNFPTATPLCAAAETLVDGAVGSPTTRRERAFLQELAPVDFLVGGPPCQGNSDLNNHTRRRDPKNGLMRLMARAAELLQPTWVLIENVPGVVHDRGHVVEWTMRALVGLGYQVDAGVVDVSRIGVAQRRRRFVIAASRVAQPSVERALAEHEVGLRALRWAIGDVATALRASTYDSSARHSLTNQERIETLFRLGVHELPNEYRPDCHRLKKHSYTSVYGRLYWDEPAPTITAGFGSTGQGRFVHPDETRTLTPHEAARVQFIPDFFRFPDVGRVALQEMVGNAVPPKLAYVLALELMR